MLEEAGRIRRGYFVDGLGRRPVRARRGARAAARVPRAGALAGRARDVPAGRRRSGEPVRRRGRVAATRRGRPPAAPASGGRLRRDRRRRRRRSTWSAAAARSRRCPRPTTRRSPTPRCGPSARSSPTGGSASSSSRRSTAGRSGSRRSGSGWSPPASPPATAGSSSAAVAEPRVPEGDTLFRTAAGLRPHLVGRAVTAARATRPGPQIERVVGATVDAVESHGKNLVIRFDNGLELRTHMRMTGSWHRYRPGERWRRPPARARRRPRGPGRGRGLLRRAGRRAVRAASRGAPPGPGDARAGPARPGVRRRRTQPRRSGGCATRPGPTMSISSALLDQRALAGIGNIWRNETLFAERVDPLAPVASLDDATLERLVATAHARCSSTALAVPRAGRGSTSTVGQDGRARGAARSSGPRRSLPRSRERPTGVRRARRRRPAHDRARRRLRSRSATTGPAASRSAATTDTTRHRVGVSGPDLGRLDPGHATRTSSSIGRSASSSSASRRRRSSERST